MKELLRELRQSARASSACEAYQDALPEFLLAEEDSTADDPQWDALRAHLATCPDCGPLYHELRTIHAESIAEDATAEDLQPPRPDLAFLRPRSLITARLDEARRLILSFAHELVTMLSTPLAPGLEPARRDAELRDHEERLVHLVEGQVSPIPVVVSLHQEQGSSYTLTVELESGKLGAERSGRRIELRRDGELVEADETNDFGLVAFTHLEVATLPSYTIEIAG